MLSVISHLKHLSTVLDDLLRDRLPSFSGFSPLPPLLFGMIFYVAFTLTGTIKMFTRDVLERLIFSDSFPWLSACRRLGRYPRQSPSATAIGTLQIFSSAAIPTVLIERQRIRAQPFTTTIHLSSFLPQTNPLFIPILLPFLK